MPPLPSRRSPFRGLAIALAGAATLAMLLPGPGARASTRTGGAQLWVARYNGPGGGDDDTRGIGVGPDGSTVFVTGEGSSASGSSEWATVAYDAVTGRQKWLSEYAGTGAQVQGLAVSPDGSRLFVTGDSFGPTLQTVDYTTVAYDAATGDQLWLSQYDGSVHQNDFADGIGVSPDGNTVFVTGNSGGGGCCFDYETIAYDASTGAQRWATRFDEPLAGNDLAVALSVSPGGGSVFVTGYSDNANHYWDWTTVAYDAVTGMQRWARRYQGPNHNGGFPAGIAVSPGGGVVYVVGLSVGSSSTDFATIAYDASTGATRWVARYDGPANQDDAATAVGVGPGGSSVFVTGWSTRAESGADFLTLSYDASTGAQRWVKRYTGAGNGSDVSRAIAVSPGGSRVFVTGESPGNGPRLDFATVAYATSSGATLWTRRYDGPAHSVDSPTGVAASPAGGRVFVTGGSMGVGTGLDFATVAYSA